MPGGARKRDGLEAMPSTSPMAQSSCKGAGRNGCGMSLAKAFAPHRACSLRERPRAAIEEIHLALHRAALFAAIADDTATRELMPIPWTAALEAGARHAFACFADMLAAG